MKRLRALTLTLTLALALGGQLLLSTSSAAAPASSVSSSPPSFSLTTTTVSPQTLAFENARLALRDGKPHDALRLWLLRNALESNGIAPTHDGDFRSVVWAALGDSGFCADGIIEDDVGGAGLWPLSIHNWLVKNVAKPPPEQPAPWSSFRGAVQQRAISLRDVLSLEELKSVRFYRGFCFMPWTLQPGMSLEPKSLQWVDMDERLSVGLMMRDVIALARRTLVKDKVEGLAVLQTRAFDLEVALARMQASKAKQDNALTDQVLRAAGVSPGGRLQLAEQRGATFSASPATTLWRASMTWPAREWLSLSQQRRLSLFVDADQGLGQSNIQSRERVILDVTDALIARRDGGEVSSWLGLAGRWLRLPGTVDDEVRAGDPDRLRLMAAMTNGERGERLLALTPADGFRERSAVALHRGVAFLKAGQTLDALRSFAVALSHADESRDAEGVHKLSQRWLAFVLSQYESNDEVLGIVDRFVPVVDYGVVVESLLWRAAFHGDVDSASKLLAAAKQKKSPGVIALGKQLQPLIEGDAGRMWSELAASKQSDASMARFAERLLDQLAIEPLDVRANHRETLSLLLEQLEPMLARAASSQQKRLTKLRLRAQTLRDDVGAFDDDVRGRLDAISLDKEAYAGSVRLAPADPLPWPFSAPQSTPPNAFAPIKLTPIEWRADDGSLVFGWSIHE